MKYQLIDITDCYNKTDIAKKLNLPSNGRTSKLIDEYINYYKISITHFDLAKSKRKYKEIIKQCPVCAKDFKSKENDPKATTTCSHACSNTHFRSGINNPNYKEDHEAGYRRVCFRYHKKECIICKEQNIVAVHHYNENHEDNTISNLVPMCPTHHTYMHSNFSYLIKDQVDQYVLNFVVASGIEPELI